MIGVFCQQSLIKCKAKTSSSVMIDLLEAVGADSKLGLSTLESIVTLM